MKPTIHDLFNSVIELLSDYEEQRLEVRRILGRIRLTASLGHGCSCLVSAILSASESDWVPDEGQRRVLIMVLEVVRDQPYMKYEESRTYRKLMKDVGVPMGQGVLKDVINSIVSVIVQRVR